MSRPRAAVLTIGSELLNGDVVDSNKAHIASSLSQAGFDVVQARTTLDDAQDIAQQALALSKVACCIVVSGGLGPTEDDITAVAVAAAFGRSVVRDPEAEAHLHRHFKAMGAPLVASNFKQADLPEGAELLPNPLGSAVGFGLAWRMPGGAQGRLWSLPGVPREMRRMLAQEVLPRCSQTFALTAATAPARLYRSMGLGESAIAERLGDRLRGAAWNETICKTFGAQCKLAPPQVHYRAHAPEVLVKLEFPELDVLPDGLAEHLDQLMAEPLGSSLYAIDAPRLVEQCAQALVDRGWTIALAESCTGGGVGELLTQAPGASRYFEGGVMVYSNALKERLLGIEPEMLQREGAVSRACAEQMARGVMQRCGAQVGLAITGIAGPEGGRDEKPVGTVFVGVATPDTQRVAHLTLRGDRLGVRRRAAQWAMRMVVDALTPRRTWLGSHGCAFFEREA